MKSFDGKRSSRSGGAAPYITLAVAFLLIAVFVAMAVFFKITTITVEGARKYDASEIIDASGVEKDTSIFFLNASKAQIAIKDTLPYVDTVRISRNLPGTVTIIVTESVGAAWFTSAGSYWIIDVGGRILEETDKQPADLVELRGITAEKPEVSSNLSLGSGESVRLRGLLDTLAAMEKWNVLDLTSWLDVSNLSAVTFEHNGYKVNIGATNDLDGKFKVLVEKVFANLAEKGSGQSIIYQEDDESFRYGH